MRRLPFSSEFVRGLIASAVRPGSCITMSTETSSDAPRHPDVVVSSAIFRRAWLVSYELPGTHEVALFDEQGSELVLLNEVGAAVWELLDGRRTVQDIVDFIVEVRQAEAERLDVQRDVQAFLAEMLTRRSIACVV